MVLHDSLRQTGWEHAKAELIRPISKGCLGPLVLGRLTANHGASRLVTLRGLGPRGARERLTEAARLVVTLKDPRLVRILGICSAAGVEHLASDPVRGLPALELCRALRAAHAPVIQEVALRLALDTLYGLEGVKDELARVGARTVCRNVYPDTVWITPEGEVQLSEVGLASLVASLAPAPAATAWCPPSASEEPERDDVFATGAFLYELLTSHPLELDDGAGRAKLEALNWHDCRLAPQLAKVVERALDAEPKRRFRNASEMARAIEALPIHWIASDRQVRSAVELLVRTSDHVEDSGGLSSGEQAIDPWQMPTRSLKARLPK